MRPTLLELNIDKKVWKFKTLNNENFKVDASINSLIKSLENDYPSLRKYPNLERTCGSDKNFIASTEIKPVKVSKHEKLSPAWDGIKKIQCPKSTFLQNIISINKKLQKTSLSLEDFRGFDDILKSGESLKTSLDSFNGHDRSVFYQLLYLKIQLQPEQIDILIKNGVVPTNSDFFFLIKNLTFQQQKQLIKKHQYELSHFNIDGTSMIANAIMFSNNEEIVPFLIEQGFPLKQSISSVDPLWIQLTILLNSDNDFSATTIASLIHHTTFNETHVSVMHKIKQNKSDMYTRLIERFPELKFASPDTLIEIECN